MAIYEIPLSPTPQSMRIALAGTYYRLRFFFANAHGAGWSLDISDDSGAPLICGIPLIPGVDLLAQYPDVGIAGRLYVATEGSKSAKPAFGDLGVLSHVYFEAAS